MAMFLEDMLDANTLYILTSNSDPKMIEQEKVAHAARKLVKTIGAIDLYPSYKSLVDQFEVLQKSHSVYTHRPFYIWQMMQAGHHLMSLNLPDVDLSLSNSIKCQAAFLTILLDDVCDLGRDRAVFDKCILALNHGNISEDETNSSLYKLIADVSQTFRHSIEQAPNYALLKPAIEDAYQKWVASFEYSLLIQEENFRLEQTWQKHLEVIAHSGTIYLGGVIDLLFAPNLVLSQVSDMIEVFVRVQKLPQIGNWITSWEREFAQQDFTSGVFSMAIENNWIKWEELKISSLEKIKQEIQNFSIESQLWDEWERLRVESLQIAREIQSPMLDGYVEIFSAIMFMQVASTIIR